VSNKVKSSQVKVKIEFNGTRQRHMKNALDTHGLCAAVPMDHDDDDDDDDTWPG